MKATRMKHSHGTDIHGQVPDAHAVRAAPRVQWSALIAGLLLSVGMVHAQNQSVAP